MAPTATDTRPALTGPQICDLVSAATGLAMDIGAAPFLCRTLEQSRALQDRFCRVRSLIALALQGLLNEADIVEALQIAAAHRADMDRSIAETVARARG